MLNPVDNTLWRMATVGKNLEVGQDLNDPSILNIHGGKENFYTFIYDLDLNLKGYVKRFLHFPPIIFHDGKMFRKEPNENPETAESLMIFKAFDLVPVE